MNNKYIETKMNNFKKVNDEFLKCTISILSCDQVANGTKFIEEYVNKASETLDYLPVIGYFNGEDFEGHGQELILSDDGIKLVIKTVPFGVCIKDSQRWVDIQKPNGEYEKYFCVDVYLWNRYAEAVDKVKENKCNQSMEVVVQNGEYKDTYYEVKDFTFSSLCILGENIPPAFKMAKIRTSDKFSKNEFKNNYSDMIFALDNYLNNLRKEDDVVDQIQIENEVSITPCEPKQIVMEEEIIDATNTEETVITDEVVVVDEVDKIEEVENVDTTIQSTTDEQYQLSKAEYDTMVEKCNNYDVLIAEKQELEQQFNELNNELTSLKEFKSKVEAYELEKSKNEIISKFQDLLLADEIEEVVSSGYSDLQKFEEKLELAFAKKELKNKAQKKEFKQQDGLKIQICSNSEIKNDGFDSIFNRYGFRSK